ncbi:MAG: ATP-binding cassette domain-containing protein [Zoogloeaceae bacterium]|jgi:putative ABC transport system ATP-binding protein|nr:ATP-binding cassette domain-containing protein [Zoogloeaceae bacterium]
MRDVRFAWEKGRAPCFSGFSLTVKAGEHWFIHGASGSGKSTLLNLAAGVLLPDAGVIRLLDQDLSVLSASGRDRFRVDHAGFIFQQFNLIPWMSVLDNTLLPCRFSRRRRQQAEAAGGDARSEAKRLLCALDMEEALWRQPAMKLSIGQQQRAAAARALLGRPELIIADEPTSSLDADRQAIFLELLRHECAASGAALLFVSHDERLAGRFTHRLRIGRQETGSRKQNGVDYAQYTTTVD